MPFGMKPRGKGSNSKLSRRARVGLSLLHYTFGESDAMELVVKAKASVGDQLVGSPEQVISTMPSAIEAAIASGNKEILGYLVGFGIDVAQDEDHQDRALVNQNVRAYLATL